MGAVGNGAFARLAATIRDNGYSVIPIAAGQKVPPEKFRWGAYRDTLPSEAQIETWAAKYPDAGLGICCGKFVVAVDIDAEDVALVRRIRLLAAALLGETPLVRVGRSPRCLLVYQVSEPIASRNLAGVDILGARKMYVAFGIHPVTGEPYQWIDDGTPEDTPLTDLPVVSQARMDAFIASLVGILPTTPDRPKRAYKKRKATSDGIEYAPDGTVTNGRDTFLFRLCLEASKRHGSIAAISSEAWRRFQAEADLSRPKRDVPGKFWTLNDAEAKAQYILANGYKGGSNKGGFWTYPRKQTVHACVTKELRKGRITPVAMRVSFAMLEHLNRNGLDMCWTSLPRLAADTGLSERHVGRGRAELVKKGYGSVSGTVPANAAGYPYLSQIEHFAGEMRKPLKTLSNCPLPRQVCPTYTLHSLYALTGLLAGRYLSCHWLLDSGRWKVGFFGPDRHTFVKSTFCVLRRVAALEGKNGGILPFIN